MVPFWRNRTSRKAKFFENKTHGKLLSKTMPSFSWSKIRAHALTVHVHAVLWELPLVCVCASTTGISEEKESFFNHTHSRKGDRKHVFSLVRLAECFCQRQAHVPPNVIDQNSCLHVLESEKSTTLGLPPENKLKNRFPLIIRPR